MARGERLVVLVDEFHLLPGHVSQPDAALKELETAAGLIAKNVGLGIPLVVTVSEGFAAKRGVQGRLLGYRAAWFTLEHLDEHFHALREEYGEQHGCKLSADTLPSLAGGSPGLLPQLCTSVEAVRQWLVSLLGSINDAAARARRLLGGEDEAYRDPRRVYAGGV